MNDSILLKLSFVQFLLQKKFRFYYNEDTFCFSLLSENNKDIICKSQFKERDNNFFLSLSLEFYIDFKFISKEKIFELSNILNHLSNSFNVVLDFPDNKKQATFGIKQEILIKQGIITSDIWEGIVLTQMSNISNISTFIFDILPTSEFYNDKSFQNKDFIQYMSISIKEYTDLKNKIKEKLSEEKILSYDENIKSMSKKEILKEIDKQLDCFKINKEESEKKLNKLIKYL